MQTRIEALYKLSQSKFRSSFHLKEKDKLYVEEKGMDVIRRHGKQTPMKGHPVFIAMHACACCCRGCLNRWYHVEKGIPLTGIQQEKIVNLLMLWIENEMKK